MNNMTLTEIFYPSKPTDETFLKIGPVLDGPRDIEWKGWHGQAVRVKDGILVYFPGLQNLKSVTD